MFQFDICSYEYYTVLRVFTINATVVCVLHVLVNVSKAIKHETLHDQSITILSRIQLVDESGDAINLIYSNQAE